MTTRVPLRALATICCASFSAASRRWMPSCPAATCIFSYTVPSLSPLRSLLREPVSSLLVLFVPFLILSCGAEACDPSERDFPKTCKHLFRAEQMQERKINSLGQILQIPAAHQERYLALTSSKVSIFAIHPADRLFR